MTSRRTVLSRPRTKLYDANYNIGESYYKDALNRLDRKYSGRPLTPPRQISPIADRIAERHAKSFADEDLNTSRKRAERLIREENLFDSRGARITRAGAMLNTLENDIDDETANSVRRLRLNKKVSLIDDVDLESTSNNLKTHRLLNRSDKILDTVGINDNVSNHETAALRRRPLKGDYDADADGLTRWTPIENNVASISVNARQDVVQRRRNVEDSSSQISSAAARARQSLSRISDLEEEMAVINEKQVAREARVARLKAMVAETEKESADFEIAQAKVERASARKEKKSVHF